MNVGARVRVTFEGTVAEVWEEGYSQGAVRMDDGLLHTVPRAATVERLPMVEPCAGSVVLDLNGLVWQRLYRPGTSGTTEWRSITGATLPWAGLEGRLNSTVPIYTP